MKKLIPILFVALVFSACQKEPSLSKLDNDYVVFTDYDSSADFSAFSTYYMPDSILRITNSKDPKYLTGNDAEYILSVYEDNMEARGYTRVDEKDIADLGLQISYVEDVSYFVIIRTLIGGTVTRAIGDQVTGVRVGITGTIRIR